MFLILNNVSLILRVLFLICNTFRKLNVKVETSKSAQIAALQASIAAKLNKVLSTLEIVNFINSQKAQLWNQNFALNTFYF